MLWCETGQRDGRATERLAAFAGQLDAIGLGAAIDARAVPAGAARDPRFEIAPWLRQGPMADGDELLLVAAEQIGDTGLAALRRLAGDAERPCVAFGRFDSAQTLIGTRARLSYVLGRDPRMVDLAGAAGFGGDMPVFGAPRRGSPSRDRPRLLLADPRLGDDGDAVAVTELAWTRRFAFAMLTDAETKRKWLDAHGTDVAVHGYGELLPTDLSERVDILACCAPLQSSYRLQCLAANLAVSGGVLLDCTPDHALARATDGFVRAPAGLTGLAGFVAAEIAPNLEELGRQVRGSAFAARVDGRRFAQSLGRAANEAGPAGPARRRAAAPRAKVVFMPTNGIGLGHAQRSALVAAALDRRRTEAVFAAFPSCVGLVKAYGFDAMPLVQRSPLHGRTYENDLVNHLRLRGLTATAGTLVFDGGFVFDSVCRALADSRVDGVWMRRGLWQAGQDNRTALDRGRLFARIIVPTEAFDELNPPGPDGARVHRVGPVVQRLQLGPARRASLREALAGRYGIGFDRLVVTQLGAGAAADRTAQIQALCGIVERRPDVLHLVLAWPGAVLHPAWLRWTRTRVVRTHHGGVLAAAADLCVSAAGYNTFHEMLYGAIPAIFLPQTGPSLDDQTARARAARERGLGGLVDPRALMTLDHTLSRFLDGGEAGAIRRRLASLALPEPGNRRAAALIEELSDGDSAVGRPAVADRSAGRR